MTAILVEVSVENMSGLHIDDRNTSYIRNEVIELNTSFEKNDSLSETFERELTKDERKRKRARELNRYHIQEKQKYN
ncbi:hypothetical protein TorRG33x02_319700 [Trema orientale]|uniref:Uncharacterized protein n=1 Tax=Trema orientale TaxID=63057 RepID=A0A2P5BIG4_TREOI|nr:hypothetical protein TorRG33x02_319700 [Trema orientale]